MSEPRPFCAAIVLALLLVGARTGNEGAHGESHERKDEGGVNGESGGDHAAASVRSAP
ncbi:hypothetical protein [Sphingomonas sp.]|uniref:hypothetical protein n=1 Tax=Sphingomonas sp. TaxID=28214 RepID=UPI003F6ED236